jgi:hypothetical protein
MKRVFLLLVLVAAGVLVPAVASAQAGQGVAFGASSPSQSIGPSGLESGGLRPPDAVDGQTPPPAEAGSESTEKELQKADQEDSGRGLEWVWLNAEIGGQHLGLQTFKANQLVDSQLVKTTQTGLLYGAGVGVRLLAFTVGARFRLGSFSDWQLWTLDAEGGLRIPLGRLEPYVSVAAGYASLGAFSGSAPLSSKATAKGVNARLGAGLDYYLSNTFSIGGNLSGDILFLSRSKVASAMTDPTASPTEAAVYAKDGSSIGAGATLTAVVGLHF